MLTTVILRHMLDTCGRVPYMHAHVKTRLKATLPFEGLETRLRFPLNASPAHVIWCTYSPHPQACNLSSMQWDPIYAQPMTRSNPPYPPSHAQRSYEQPDCTGRVECAIKASHRIEASRAGGAPASERNKPHGIVSVCGKRVQVRASAA